MSTAPPPPRPPSPGCCRQKFPANDHSIGKELTTKFKKAGGGGVEWKRADLLKPTDDGEPFHLFNQVRRCPRGSHRTVVARLMGEFIVGWVVCLRRGLTDGPTEFFGTG